MGARRGGASRRNYPDSDDDEYGSSSDDGVDEDALGMLSPEEREEALVQSAMARIERAKSRGSTDVDLTEGELAALEARRKREEEEQADRRSRKKSKKQRVAVPLTNLEPVSRKKKSSRTLDSDLSREASATNLLEPSYSSRNGSGTSTTARPPSRTYDDTPDAFQYEYTSRSGRHGSDSSRSKSTRSYDDNWKSNPSPASSSSNRADPFRFQTAGPRGQQSTGSSLRPLSSVNSSSGPVTRSRGSREQYISDESSEDTSDDLDNGAHIVDSSRERSSIVDTSPESGSHKKKSSSPTKRKGVASSRKSRR
ncbi:hypothetical protein N3K66_001227 [Trichothecium roseum]|uniref:Uncharacterized protein n=1 Tax=Trichothecium roseum TaxID=47278 RepID=A0ACC0VG10_9HYPO|nr:hypothetical protein N3K66_001227 [Trichothecium roseum]